MHVLSPPDLLRPQRLLRTRAPWTALVYLAAETLGGLLAAVCWTTIVLIPVWLLLWPRLEPWLLPLAGHRRPQLERGPWELRWRDLVLVLLTPVLASAMFIAGVSATVVLIVLFWIPVVVAGGGTLTGIDASQELPALPTAVLAPLLGLVLLALLLWGAVALAWGWGRVSVLLLVDVERRLAEQVDALSLETVRREDAIALERRVLQRDLHDGAQMHLSAAAMRLGMLELDAEALPAGPGRTRVLEGLEAAREQVDLGAQSVRDAAQGLVPVALRDGGLCPALGEAAAALPFTAEVSCDVPRLREEVEQSLFLVASEALTNVVRHAEASRVRIRCGLDGGDARLLVLEVADDGRGGAEPTGTGLVSITARVRGLGGTCTVDSPVGGPTVLHVRVPLDDVRRTTEGAA